MATLEGRTALVTGASGRGMGRSIALTLARDGANVVVNFRKRRDRAEEMAAVIESMGRRALVYQADTADANAVRDMVRAAESELGNIDIAVASAGGSWQPADLPDIEPDHWRSVMAEEIDSAYALIRAALPGMRERGWGRIVLIGGLGADDWRFGPPDAPLDYPLGKAARHWLARTLGPRERERGVTINAVAPGPIDYVTLEQARELANEEHSGDTTSTPQAVADVVAFLCSQRAGAISGAVIPVAGTRKF